MKYLARAYNIIAKANPGAFACTKKVFAASRQIFKPNKVAPKQFCYSKR